MDSELRIRRAQCIGTDEREMVRAFHAAVSQPDMSLVIFFCSHEFDLGKIAEEIRRLFVGVEVVGCTTAGEIGPEGYGVHGISGASFPARDFQVVVGCLDGLQCVQIKEGYSFAQQQLQRLEASARGSSPEHSFGLMLIDGMSMREEPVAHAFQEGLGQILLVGGSAGDGLKFGRTHVYAEGRFRTDSAVLILVATQLPFVPFKIQHFIATDKRMVVTKADPAHRIVEEIDGLPAAGEFANLLGIAERDLNEIRFAASPVVVMLDGTNYVRSIQKVNPDESLKFFCAIEEGLVLRVAQGVDMVKNLEQALADLRSVVGPPQLMLAFDCILRRLEVDHKHITDQVGSILAGNCATGFNTYGEQFHGVHVNQTLTGIAIGAAAAAAHA